MFGLTPWHLVLVLGVALLVLGPGKLPETGAAIGKAIRGFQDAAAGRDEAVPAPAEVPASTSLQPPSAPGTPQPPDARSDRTSA